ncbi:MAG: DHH family phosphoesterase, partial [bacterium]
KVAMVAFESRCDIQGLIAETWRRLLSRYIVIAANFGYIEGKVAYVIRSQTDVNLIEFMESMRPAGYDQHICFGHDHAGGGIIAKEIWKYVAEKMGFSKP